MHVGLFVLGLLVGGLAGWRWGARAGLADDPATHAATLRRKLAEAEEALRDATAEHDALQTRVAELERARRQVSERQKQLEAEADQAQRAARQAQEEEAKARAALNAERDRSQHLGDRLSDREPPRAAAAGEPAPAGNGAVSLPAAPAGKGPDDLEAIRGIGPIVGKKLTELGILTFAQLAALEPSQTAAIEQAIGFPGRVGRERWIEQAQDRVKAD